jgi:hypothetical protein
MSLRSGRASLAREVDSPGWDKGSHWEHVLRALIERATTLSGISHTACKPGLRVGISPDADS